MEKCIGMKKGFRECNGKDKLYQYCGIIVIGNTVNGE